MNPVNGAGDMCPYCGRFIDEDGGNSRDHVFVKALGGRATVSAGRDCNNILGSGLEGELQRPDQLLNLIKQLAGRGRPMRGTIGPQDSEVEYSMTTGEVRSVKPVKTTVEPGKTTYRIQGSPAQAESILRQMASTVGLSESDVQHLLESAERVPLGDEMFRTEVSYSLSLGHQLAAKVGLGAGKIATKEFPASPLASELRQILSGGQAVERTVHPDALASFDRIVEASLKRSGRSVAPIAVSEADPFGRATFLPFRNRTALFVRLAGFDLGQGGLLINQRMPFGALPVVVIDGPTGPTVRRLEEEVGAAVALIESVEGPGLR